MNPVIVQFLISAYGQAIGTVVPAVSVYAHYAKSSPGTVKLNDGTFNFMNGSGCLVLKTNESPQRRIVIKCDTEIDHIRIDADEGIRVVLKEHVREIYDTFGT